MLVDKSGLKKTFDRQTAAKEVERWIDDRRQVPEAHSVSIIEARVHEYKVLHDAPPYFGRVVFPTTEEEVVFRAQGVLSSTSLPPLQCSNPGSVATRRLHYTYQRVGLIGLGSKSFEDQVRKIRELHALVNRSGSRPSLRLWAPEKAEECNEIIFKSRLFTTGKDAANCTRVDIPAIIDRTEAMRELVKRADVEYGEENFVEFQVLVYDDEHQTRSYEIFDPESYQIGDMVEVQFTILAVPSGDEDRTVHFLVVLRGLTKLDGKLAQEADIRELEEASRADVEPFVPKRSIKRRIGYNREDPATLGARKRVATLGLTQREDDSTMETGTG